jgi:hypothetical protein
MSGAVYLLCAATSLVCAGLLFRAYGGNALRLLLWSALCFVGLTIDNILLFIDITMTPHTDLSAWRNLPALAGLSVLLYGLVWDAK